MITVNNEAPRQYAADVAAVDAAKEDILTTREVLGVTGTLPPAVVQINHIPNNTVITNYIGSISGISLTRPSLRVGADGDPTKNCRLSSLSVSLAGTEAQSIFVYGNERTWVLTVSDAFKAGGAMQISAQIGRAHV